MTNRTQQDNEHDAYVFGVCVIIGLAVIAAAMLGGM